MMMLIIMMMKHFLEGKPKYVIPNNEILNGNKLSEKTILGAGNSLSSVFRIDNLSH